MTRKVPVVAFKSSAHAHQPPLLGKFYIYRLDGSPLVPESTNPLEAEFPVLDLSVVVIVVVLVEDPCVV